MFTEKEHTTYCEQVNLTSSKSDRKNKSVSQKQLQCHVSTFTFTYPLTLRVTGAPQIISQPVSSIFLCSTALWDLANSRPVHSLKLSSHLFLHLPRLLSLFTAPCKMVLARPDEQETCPYHCSLHLFMMVRRSSYVQLPAGSWHGLPRW